MIISAKVIHAGLQHSATVRTGQNERSLAIPAKTLGKGSSVNGGELLFLALATCYCNDIYREAGERGIEIASVQVEVTGQFGAKGEPASDIRYRAAIRSNAPREQLLELMTHTDTVAEIQNTLRHGASVTLEKCQVL